MSEETKDIEADHTFSADREKGCRDSDTDSTIGGDTGAERKN